MEVLEIKLDPFQPSVEVISGESSDVMRCLCQTRSAAHKLMLKWQWYLGFRAYRDGKKRVIIIALGEPDPLYNFPSDFLLDLVEGQFQRDQRNRTRLMGGES